MLLLWKNGKPYNFYCASCGSDKTTVIITGGVSDMVGKRKLTSKRKKNPPVITAQSKLQVLSAKDGVPVPHFVL